MTTTYHLQVITPEGKIFDDQVESLNAPGEVGGFSVLANHAPMIAKIKTGTLKILQAGTEKNIAVEPGVVEVNAEHQVLVLSSAAHFV